MAEIQAWFPIVPRYRSTRYRHRSQSTDSSYGRERAAQHIREAQQLSIELGGTDKDVKKYFFDLSSEQLVQILQDYEDQYGADARAYAEETLPKWRTGRVKMSGLVAGRLFSLLPPRMPLATKYALTENLWSHFGPRSKMRLRITPGADAGEVASIVRSHFDNVVSSYRIPDQLNARFNWLSSGDVELKQDLLNHLLKMENELIELGVREQLPVLETYLASASEGVFVHTSQWLRVGGHELELVIDPHVEVSTMESWSAYNSKAGSIPARPSQKSGGVNWLVWVIGALVLISALRSCA